MWKRKQRGKHFKKVNNKDIQPNFKKTDKKCEPQ